MVKNSNSPFGRNSDFSSAVRIDTPVILYRDEVLSDQMGPNQIVRFRTFDTPRVISRPSQPDDDGESHMKHDKDSVSKIEFRIGVGLAILAFAGAAVGTTWAVSSKIYDSNNAVRQEITGVVLASKTELATRIDKVEDKVDAGFKDNSDKLNDLKVLLMTKSDKK